MCKLSHYRSALALNNMGVALLRRGAHRQGLATLKDAVATMRLVFPNPAKPCPVLTGIRVEDMIQDASLRLASPQGEQTGMLVKVVSHEDCDLDTIEEVLKHIAASSFSQVFLLHLEPPEYFVPEDRIVDFDAAVMLYNFGMAHMCLAKASSSLLAISELQNGALGLFHLAHSILVSQASRCDTPTNQLHLSFVGALVLNSFSFTLRCQGRATEADEATLHLARLLTILYDEEENIEAFYGEAATRAAAAA